MWRWFSINVGEDMHFGGIRLGTEAGDLHRGWVWNGERATSIAEWRLRTELEDDGFTHRVVHVQVLDKKDRTYDLRGDVMRVADIGQGRGTVVNEGLARWTYEDRTGYGICEYLHQLDDRGMPVVPVEETMAAARVEVVDALGRVLGGRVEDLRRLSGGASRVTSSFDLIDNAGVRRQLVIQQDRGDGATQIGAVSAEAALLRAAHRGGVA